MEENEQIQEVAEQTSDAFLEGWDDESPVTFETEEPVSEEPTPAADSAPESAQESAAEQNADEPANQQAQADAAAQSAPAMRELNYMGERKLVSDAELVQLAQKGMDYDRVRGKYDESKPVMAMFEKYAKAEGQNVSEYLNTLRSREIQEAQGVSAEDAARQVSLEDREAAIREREQAYYQAQQAEQAARAAAAEQAKRAADLEQFKTLFPDAAEKPEDIPQDTWALVNSGMPLTGAYAIHAVEDLRAQVKSLQDQLAASQKNADNQQRTTGSMGSTGSDVSLKTDAFLAGWDED